MIIPKIPQRPEKKTYLVIAGNQQQFNLYCDEMLERYEKTGQCEGFDFVYYSLPDLIRGYRFDGYLFWGTGYERDDVDMNVVRSCLKSEYA